MDETNSIPSTPTPNGLLRLANFQSKFNEISSTVFNQFNNATQQSYPVETVKHLFNRAHDLCFKSQFSSTGTGRCPSPVAAGSNQSPIDIQTEECQVLPATIALPFEFNYPSLTNLPLSNNGLGWVVQVNQQQQEGQGQAQEHQKPCLIRGGPLNFTYTLEQFHCHWGQSEHTINGEYYDGELHLVHWNLDKYSHFQEALHREDGLVVLAVFLKVNPNCCSTDDHHPELHKVTSNLDAILYQNDSTILSNVTINCTAFLPENTQSYYTYSGSLTTPPYLESVTFIVFKEPIIVSQQQLENCKQLYNSMASAAEESAAAAGEERNRIVANYRPLMEKGDRIVYSCGCD